MVNSDGERIRGSLHVTFWKPAEASDLREASLAIADSTTPFRERVRGSRRRSPAGLDLCNRTRDQFSRRGISEDDASWIATDTPARCRLRHWVAYPEYS